MAESENTLAESEWYGCWITLAESEWYGRVSMAKSEYFGRITITESEWYGRVSMAESEYFGRIWLLQSKISYTIGISWSLVHQIPRHMPGRRQSRLDHAWG